MEFIDLHKQYTHLKKEIDDNILFVVNSASFIGGSFVKRLEKELADYVCVKHCLTCANGTDALTLALRAIGAKEGDAIFVADYTYFASAEVIALERATPIFVDADKTYNMSPFNLEKAINAVIEENVLNPKAIIVVDLFGQPANYLEIKRIADKYNLLIIEDAAQGFGGNINGKMTCSFGDISTTSFFPVKPLGCYGDGGAVFTDNDEYYQLMCSLAVHGKGEDKYDNVRIGYNSRLDAIQAAILLPKFHALVEHELDDRDRVAAYYTEKLKNKFVTPTLLPGFRSSWAQYTLLAKDENERNTVISKLKEKDIPIMVYYRNPMHCEKVFKDIKLYVELPNSEDYMKRAFSIPFNPYMTKEEQDIVIEELLKI